MIQLFVCAALRSQFSGNWYTASANYFRFQPTEAMWLQIIVKAQNIIIIILTVIMSVSNHMNRHIKWRSTTAYSIVRSWTSLSKRAFNWKLKDTANSITCHISTWNLLLALDTTKLNVKWGYSDLYDSLTNFKVVNKQHPLPCYHEHRYLHHAQLMVTIIVQPSHWKPHYWLVSDS